jgi:hypothetical protein
VVNLLYHAFSIPGQLHSDQGLLQCPILFMWFVNTWEVVSYICMAAKLDHISLPSCSSCQSLEMQFNPYYYDHEGCSPQHEGSWPPRFLTTPQGLLGHQRWYTTLSWLPLSAPWILLKNTAEKVSIKMNVYKLYLCQNHSNTGNPQATRNVTSLPQMGKTSCSDIEYLE